MGKRRNRKEKTEGGREETLGTSPGLHPPKTRASPASTFSSIVIHRLALFPPFTSSSPDDESITGQHLLLLLHRHPPTTKASPASMSSSCATVPSPTMTRASPARFFSLLSFFFFLWFLFKWDFGFYLFWNDLCSRVVFCHFISTC